MSEALVKEHPGNMGQILIHRAQAFREQHQDYLRYADVARESLTSMIENRIKELADLGCANDAHDGLLNQLRGLRKRFAEVDAITRSLLLLVDGGDPLVWEEVLAFVQGLVSLELEARVAQRRVALAAVIRDYVGGQMPRKDRMVFTVTGSVSRHFHSLTSEIRDLQNRLYGRQDTFTHEDLLARLIALGSSNPGLLALMGTPALPRTTSGKTGHAQGFLATEDRAGKRELTFEVDIGISKRFHALVSEVRDLQHQKLAQMAADGHDGNEPQRPFESEDLLTRLVALGSANPEILIQMGNPAPFTLVLVADGGKGGE